MAPVPYVTQPGDEVAVTQRLYTSYAGRVMDKRIRSGERRTYTVS
jgi:hypothetical protein